MDQLEVRHGGRLGLLRSATWNIDGIASIDFGRKGEVTKEGWMMAIKKGHPAMKEEIWKWISILLHVDASWIDRWGFLRGNWENVDPEKDRRYEVARIVLASGNQHGWRKHQYYASSVMSGNARTFWAIDFYTLEATDFGDFPETGSPITSDVEQGDCDAKPRFEIRFDEKRQARYMIELDRWFLCNSDKPKILRGPGRRGASKQSSLFHTDLPVACFSQNGQCMRAAVANALFLLEGHAPAREMLSKGRLRVRSLAHAGSWVEKNMRSFSLRNVKIPANTPELYWLSEQEEGVFIISLEGRDCHNESISHVVALDAKKRVIMDCAERYALKIRLLTFDSCLGDGVKFKRVLEVKQIVRQPTGKRKRRPHKMRKEKQKMLRFIKREEKREALARRPRCNKRIALSDDE